MTSIEFTAHERPLVSIVMPTYGQWPWVRAALAALAAFTDEPSEVIVVDNASQDGTDERLTADVEGCQLVLNPRNYGFGAACNQGAARARGNVIAFLNSDALVHRGWLPPLLAAFDDPSVGAAAPRVLNVDGSLQEAGGVVAPGYGASAYGAGDDPERPQYRFPRTVDYASAACLAVRRRAFTEVGGFDSAYGAGYFEDVDLCLALAEQGYRVLYVPRSTITHVQWISFGEADARALVDANRAIFSRRWRGRLGLRPNTVGHESETHLIAARDAIAPVRVLGLADEPGRVARLLSNVIDAWPTARATLLVAKDGRAAELLERGVEVASPADPAAWLWERRFHYDALVRDGCSELEGVLQETQPQAVRLSAADAATVVETLIGAGTLPP